MNSGSFVCPLATAHRPLTAIAVSTHSLPNLLSNPFLIMSFIINNFINILFHKVLCLLRRSAKDIQIYEYF